VLGFVLRHGGHVGAGKRQRQCKAEETRSFHGCSLWCDGRPLAAGQASHARSKQH
jgi:hypothetical protein